MDAPSPNPSPGGRPDRLGAFLREARLNKGLELSDVAARTHVRKEYLSALEEGRYQALPEDVFARNFVKLYARAVGLPTERALELYGAERRRATSAAPEPRPAARRVPASPKADEPVPGAAPPKAQAAAGQAGAGVQAALPDEPSAPRRTTTLLASSPAPAKPVRRTPQVGAWLPTLLLIVVIGALAVWAFNALLARPRAPAAEDPATSPAASAPLASESAPQGSGASNAEVASGEQLAHLSLVTDPPGAQVSIDGFPVPGTTPIEDYPFSPSSGRTLRITLEGYEPYQEVIDLSQDVSLEVPLRSSAAETPAEAEASAPAEAPPSAGSGPVTVRIEEESWLEAYASTQRGVGERLVYTTVEPGQTFTFPLPVYLHVGNAAGVRVWVNDQDRGLMGSSGEVVSRAFTQ